MAESMTNSDLGSKDLSLVPEINFGFVENFAKAKSKSHGDKELSKGYKYFCEKYITNVSVHKIDNGCIIKARCFRSMKKNESPHNMEVTLLSDPSVTSSICTCTIGQGGSCGHVVGLLYFLAHMKSSGFKSIPSDVLKTSLPQTWHVPRGDKLQGSAVDNVVLCGYSPKDPTKQPRGLRSTLYNPIKGEFPEVHDLCDAFSNIDNSILLMSVIENTEPPKLETRFGKFVKGSPLSYQQKQSSQYVLNILGEDFPVLPIENCMENEVAVVLNSTSTVNFQSIMVSRNESEEIEKMTRLQSSDPKWHAVRRDRITASVAGDIIKRRADNDPLVTRLKSTRKVMTEAMRHGVMFEPIAANAYSSLQNNNVNIFPCGIVVSPYASWLAASPDRKVYNPAMRPPYGLLEIKCPVKQLADCIYLTKSDDGRICLKKNHNYYYQVMMQMAVTGLQWCHFFVWRPDEQHIEKINFDQEEWNDMKRKLDMFYFYHFLN